MPRHQDAQPLSPELTNINIRVCRIQLNKIPPYTYLHVFTRISLRKRRGLAQLAPFHYLEILSLSQTSNIYSRHEHQHSSAPDVCPPDGVGTRFNHTLVCPRINV